MTTDESNPGVSRSSSVLRTSSSSSSSSYAGSARSVFSASENPSAAVAERVADAVNPIALDRALALQTQRSGMLHACAKELEEYRAQVVEKADRARVIAANVQQLIKKIQADVHWLRKHVNALTERVRIEAPVEYSMAVEQVHPLRRQA